MESNSDEFSSLLKIYNDWYPNPIELGYANVTTDKIPDSFFLKDVSRLLDNPFFIPVERGLQSIFSLGKNSLSNLSDSLFNQFSKIDGIARNFKGETTIEPLNIFYKNENGVGKFKSNNQDSFFLMSTAASGYQSLIPISLVCMHYEKRSKSKTIIVEEPELNLFPKTQYDLVKYIANITTRIITSF
ncbi:MAG: AAA family ATPase [Bacteroidetes bacterium]|nr:AAA family ATPase [Bacteroidota bacterium]